MLYWLNVCMYLYNEMLEDRKNAYDRCGVGLKYNQQAGQLKYLNLGIYSQVAQDVLRRLDKAFQNFFRRVKNGETKVGYPRFQGNNQYDSFTCPQTGFKIQDGKIHLSKIGALRIFQHQEIENPKTLNKYDSKLRKAQGDLSRKKKGSSNRCESGSPATCDGDSITCESLLIS